MENKEMFQTTNQACVSLCLSDVGYPKISVLPLEVKMIRPDVFKKVQWRIAQQKLALLMLMINNVHVYMYMYNYVELCIIIM